LILFDYFYYRLVYFYEHSFGLILSKEIEGFTSLMVFQFFNVATILSFIETENKVGNDHFYILVIVFVLIILFNLIRYNKIVTYFELAEKWDKEPRKPRLIKKIGIICYCILSIFLFIFSTIKTR
jgi:hypothetical protein